MGNWWIFDIKSGGVNRHHIKTFSHFAEMQGPLDEWHQPKQAALLLMEEIPNNHLGCIKPCK